MVKYRIDRMCDVQIMEEEAYIDSDFNVVEYSKKAIKMFDDNLPGTGTCGPQQHFLRMGHAI